MKISKQRLKEIIKEELGSLSEKDDKVSKKISYLMDKEGKPQKQAVAIALDMEERGKLEEAAPMDLIGQFIGFIQQNPEVAVAAISANAAALGIATALETIADKVRAGLAKRDMKEAMTDDEADLEVDLELDNRAFGDKAKKDDDDALVFKDRPDIKRMKQGLKRMSRPRSAGDFRSDKERFKKP